MSKPTLKMTHGAIGEAMCCYTDGSYKDADIALTEYENSIRADERAKTIAEVSRELEKYHNDICRANYPFNFIDMALNNVRGRKGE